MTNPSIFFGKTIQQCPVIGRQGGLRAVRNRRRRMISQPPAPSEVEAEVDRETMAEARARIDALCPWLRGVEMRTRRQSA